MILLPKLNINLVEALDLSGDASKRRKQLAQSNLENCRTNEAISSQEIAWEKCGSGKRHIKNAQIKRHFNQPVYGSYLATS